MPNAEHSRFTQTYLSVSCGRMQWTPAVPDDSPAWAAMLAPIHAADGYVIDASK